MQSNIISSMQNPIIKEIMLLQKKKSHRKKEGLFIVESIKAVNEIPSGYPIKYLIVTPLITREQLPVLETNKKVVVTEEVYKAISDTITPQGAMAVVEMPAVALDDLTIKGQGFYLILENMQDPGNLGTIIRTAHAFGAEAVLITKGSVDLYSPKVVRATMGSLFHVKACIDYEIEDYMTYVRKVGAAVYAADLENAEPLSKVRFKSPLAIVIGNEGSGVSKYTKKTADHKVMIPMPGGSESLNASVAASICMYEVMKQLDHQLKK